HVNNLSKKADEIWIKHNEANKLTNIMECAKAYANDILPAMEEARYFADEMEPLLGEEYKPFPSYEDLLFRI
ncbi:MAG: glutamine synthetase type III, partial [Treponema sp.]|nr:glutamine synthetase type III [Treponema sp.]